MTPLSERLFAVGREAFAARNFAAAVACFEKALETEPRNAVLHFNLASAEEMRGETARALVCLTRALRHKPSWIEPARRLSTMLQRGAPAEPAALDAIGLLAAFSFDTVDHQLLGNAAFAHLKAATPLGDAGRAARQGSGLDAARNLLVKRTDKVLTLPLMLTALAKSAVQDPDMEELLAVLRRVIVAELPLERFADKDLVSFACGLLQQVWKTQHIRAADEAETAALAARPLDWQRVAAGEPDAGITLLLNALALPWDVIADGRISTSHCAAIRPKIVGQTFAGRVQDDEATHALAPAIPSITPLRGEVSRRVAQQYEANPYPRWSSLHVAEDGAARRMLQRFFAADELDFMARSFRVLVAGAGTGQHATASAAGYAPEGEVLAIDLSRASLAYGQRMASRLKIHNIAFAQADIGALDNLVDRFEIIEAVGVLHHMDDPFGGWRTLLRRLKPGGLMWIGLYSATARAGISRIRQRKDFPGAGCSDDEARAFRDRLLADARSGDADCAALLRSRDFYALSDVRDLVLHEHELPLGLPEISTFLEDQRLRFRGFMVPAAVEAAFLSRFPGVEWPGTLDQWHAFEQAFPSTFNGMYKFWCGPAPAPQREE